MPSSHVSCTWLWGQAQEQEGGGCTECTDYHAWLMSFRHSYSLKAIVVCGMTIWYVVWPYGMWYETPTKLRRSTLAFRRLGKNCLHQMRSAVRRRRDGRYTSPESTKSLPGTRQADDRAIVGVGEGCNYDIRRKRELSTHVQNWQRCFSVVVEV